jgi:hypothetical protein
VRSLPFSAALFLAALAPAPALAHGGGAAMPAQVPDAPPGDGATAQAILKELEAKAQKDAEIAKVIAEPVAAAKRALERAHGARTAKDDAHAKMLDGLALEWAETARELDRAAAAEKVAREAAQKALEAQTKADRARALLEETQARRGRAAAELARVEQEAKESAKGAADAEAQRLDAAKKKGARAAVPVGPRAAPNPTAPSAPTAPAKPKKGSK